MTELQGSGESAQPESQSYDLVVSLGTDYHKFDRLVDWVDSYLAKHPDLTCLFQHGFTDKPRNATRTVDRMPRAELLKFYEQARVVLVQGGPGSILDAREVGVIPLAVPRLHKFDEVVDDHQVEFSKVMESYGETIIAHDAQDLEKKLDAAFADPSMVTGSRRQPGADQAAAELNKIFANFAPSSGHDVRKFARRWGQVIRGIVGR
ncbi:MAG: glycosyltransferase [Rothia sp. (in: high G+C Gram-positive bacteria)]|nr:glycosyltransferase [Rothia sp. (in: high G+C Gram-positive bacteria)]